ncbi:MAG: 3-hydroxyacyl-CoA dehydrogenase NAD-binding domain-containing protein, partial [Alphaproteobacteria bacterium]
MIQSIGIIGAGQMGSGITHVCAVAGLDIVLVDSNPRQLEKSLDIIRANMARQVKRGHLDDQALDAAMARIALAGDINALSAVDMVIEAATENEKVKVEILKALCPVIKPEALVATNTSSISITRLASSTDRPEKFMGMHFMNPVPIMKLVELIRGLATTDETFEAVRHLTERLNKEWATSEDFPAFIVNRILLPMINEAVYTLYEGVGTVEAIDTSMRLGANHPMGPLELADFIGLDICLAVM